MCFCGVFISSAGYRFSPDVCTDGLDFSILMIFPAGYFFGGTMLKVRPKTYNTKHTTTGDHVDRRILQYSRANKRITACHTELVLCIVTHVLCKGIIREIIKTWKILSLKEIVLARLPQRSVYGARSDDRWNYCTHHSSTCRRQPLENSGV